MRKKKKKKKKKKEREKEKERENRNQRANAPNLFQRNLPARGFKPATLLLLGSGVMLFGWYKFGAGAREQR